MIKLSDILKQLADIQVQMKTPFPDLTVIRRVVLSKDLDLSEELKDQASVQRVQSVVRTAQEIMDTYNKAHSDLIRFYEQFEDINRYAMTLGMAVAGRKVIPRPLVVPTSAQIEAMKVRAAQERAKRDADHAARAVAKAKDDKKKK